MIGFKFLCESERVCGRSSHGSRDVILFFKTTQLRVFFFLSMQEVLTITTYLPLILFDDINLLYFTVGITLLMVAAVDFSQWFQDNMGFVSISLIRPIEIIS